MKNAVLMNEQDNVAVLTEPLRYKDLCIYTDSQGKEHSISIMEDIPVYHKAALCEIAKGEQIIKYGECIGVAVDDIAQGEHVHVHNVRSSKLKKGVMYD